MYMYVCTKVCPLHLDTFPQSLVFAYISIPLACTCVPYTYRSIARDAALLVLTDAARDAGYDLSGLERLNEVIAGEGEGAGSSSGVAVGANPAAKDGEDEEEETPMESLEAMLEDVLPSSKNAFRYVTWSNIGMHV